MKVKLPIWCEALEDEALISLVGFMYRISENYGYNNWYDMVGSDMSIIANKHLEGLIEWLREMPEFKENIKLTYFEDTQEVRWTLAYAKKRQQRKESICYKELTTDRAKIIWLYLLGVSNHNLVYEGDLKPVKYHRLNTLGIKEFKIDRIPVYKQEKILKKRGRKNLYKPLDGTQETN